MESILQIEPHTATSDEEERMIDLCFEAKTQSYSPYSRFRVGASLKTKDGTFYKGCNVENSSYGLSICAERTALVKAISEGHQDFESIFITSDVADTYISPCGACRQFIMEFGDLDVYLVRPDRTFKKMKGSQLLPLGFSPGDLQKNRDVS
eukprot:TRINITY_DN5803_c0_g1_i1.p1 TRINITY_DN5803_c0_g1~~TRINITY_DN5803_c0_g1_i1.p1  ORF type:complete len:151 (+),score=23.41 TRINITY_DN5803_c0_g1_i1:93-545(+)